MPDTVTVIREKLYPATQGTNHYAWKWIYSYQVDDNQPSPTQGTSITELRSMLKRRFPGVAIIEPWKART